MLLDRKSGERFATPFRFSTPFVSDFVLSGDQCSLFGFKKKFFDLGARTHRLWFFTTKLAVEPSSDSVSGESIRSLIMSLFVSLEFSGNGSRRITCGFHVPLRDAF